MKKRFKTKWLKALRSGEYKQGKGQLVREDNGGDRFCCLGVLVDVDQGFEEKERMAWDGTSLGSELRADGSFTALTGNLLERYGIKRHEQGHLIKMNDDRNNRFTTIANWIEKNL